MTATAPMIQGTKHIIRTHPFACIGCGYHVTPYCRKCQYCQACHDAPTSWGKASSYLAGEHEPDWWPKPFAPKDTRSLYQEEEAKPKPRWYRPPPVPPSKAPASKALDQAFPDETGA